MIFKDFSIIIDKNIRNVEHVTPKYSQHFFGAKTFFLVPGTPASHVFETQLSLSPRYLSGLFQNNVLKNTLIMCLPCKYSVKLSAIVLKYFVE